MLTKKADRRFKDDQASDVFRWNMCTARGVKFFEGDTARVSARRSGLSAIIHALYGVKCISMPMGKILIAALKRMDLEVAGL